ncbi:MAG: M15 family metallopeptidase [Spirochaetaceae bacterium]|jgi:D-alanyl-D-alanine carboxypeptidase|nr:M15 family metallopeptidase [Spirochaetaceae bacterium]
MRQFVFAVFCLASFSGCFGGQSNAVNGQEADGQGQSNTAESGFHEPDFRDDLQRILRDARLPPELALDLSAAAQEGPSFILDLLAVLEGDPYLRILVDKAHALPDGYEPGDLVALSGPSYRTGRNGLLLRQEAADALEEMAAAAGAEGLTLTVSSTYRSYNYQVEVYARNVREDGQEEADRVSARPGHSQHQLGLVVDFGSISDEFAGTREGRWLLSNAGRFGWSLSFPDGYEALTGYRWESWHYRYVGRDLAHFIDTYFNGIQQYALQFIRAWEEADR